MKALPAKKCLEKALENPRLNDVLLGLDRTKPELPVNPKFFPCCSGSAEIWNDGTIFRCGIFQRQIFLQRLMQVYYRMYNRDMRDAPGMKDPKANDAALRELAAMLKSDAPQGLKIDCPKNEPSLIWLRAAAAVWRFGLQPVVASFDLQCDVRVRSELKKLPPNASPLIFIERVHKLWDAKFAYSFEAILSLAYKTNSLLLFSLEEEGDTPQPAIPQNFSKKLGQLRSKPYDAWLEPESRARLQDILSQPRTEPFVPVESQSQDW